MKLRSRFAQVSALAMMLVLVVAQSKPALALEGAQWFWTTENDQNPFSYQQCQQQATTALATMGTPGSNGGYHWINAPNFYVILVCINRPRGMNVLLSVTAADSQIATQIGNQIGNAFWHGGAASAPSMDLTGTWTDSNGATYQIVQSGNSINWHYKSADGFSEHDFQGTINGNQIAGHFQSVGSSYNGDLVFQITDTSHLTLLSNSVPFGSGPGYTIMRQLPG